MGGHPFQHIQTDSTQNKTIIIIIQHYYPPISLPVHPRTGASLQPVAQIPSQQQPRSFFTSATGCTINTILYDWQPSFPGSRSKNMEQPAIGSDVI